MGATEGVRVPVPPGLAEFRLTFGVQYHHTAHPHWAGANPDGWLTILAADEEAARLLARAYLGNVYAFTYPAERFDPKYYPLGELARISAAGSTDPTLVRRFTASDPEFYGRASTEVIACRIEGILKADPGTDPDVELVHPDCFEAAALLFARIDEVDRAVMAWELDWANPHECPVCETSIT